MVKNKYSVIFMLFDAFSFFPIVNKDDVRQNVSDWQSQSPFTSTANLFYTMKVNSD